MSDKISYIIINSVALRHYNGIIITRQCGSTPVDIECRKIIEHTMVIRYNYNKKKSIFYVEAKDGRFDNIF